MKMKKSCSFLHDNVLQLTVVAIVSFSIIFSGLCSCSNKESANSDKDSIVYKVDSADIRDSLMWAGFHSSDLTFWELHGHVKMMLKDGVAYEFDKDGVWTLIDGRNPMNGDVSFDASNNSYVRNKNGLIVREQNWEGYSVYSWLDGMLTGKAYFEGSTDQAYSGRGEQGYQSRSSFAYDSLGRLHSVGMQEKEDGEKGWSKEVKTTYQYLKEDGQGNWLIRKSHDGLEQRDIAYWDRPAYHRDTTRFLPLNQTYVFTGTTGSKKFAALILGYRIGACNIDGQSYDISLKSYNENKGIATFSMLSPVDGKIVGEWRGTVKRNFSPASKKSGSWTYNGTLTFLSGKNTSFSLNEK